MPFDGKFVSAVGFGMAHTIAPVYMAETAPNVLRGICLVLVVSLLNMSFAIERSSDPSI